MTHEAHQAIGLLNIRCNLVSLVGFPLSIDVAPYAIDNEIVVWSDFFLENNIPMVPNAP